jgi:AcrR family transcriptional regulator
MSGQMTARAERPVATRQQILDTALRLFTDAGYFNTSIHDIQRESGVSIGSIYNHFGGKEGIAKALYDELLAQMSLLVEQVTTRHASAMDRGRAVVTRLFQLAEESPDMMRFILNAKHREFLPDQQPICSAKPFVQLREIVNQGMATGEIRRMDPWVAASCAFGPALRMISLRLDRVLPYPLTGRADTVWDAAWRAVAEVPGSAVPAECP